MAGFPLFHRIDIHMPLQQKIHVLYLTLMIALSIQLTKMVLTCPVSSSSHLGDLFNFYSYTDFY